MRRLIVFQSHNGAIAAFKDGGEFASEDCLSIPQWCDCCNLNGQHNVSAKRIFQSHNGAIAAPSLLLQHLTHLRFQSHNGAIAAQEGRRVD